MSKKRLQFNMEQAPTFGQLYVHIEKIGNSDSIGGRQSQSDSINNRATGTAGEENLVKTSNETDIAGDSLERQPEKVELILPKRNLFVRFKAFPNLEQVKTTTVWQQDEHSAFDYRAQFPVLMTPD